MYKFTTLVSVIVIAFLLSQMMCKKQPVTASKQSQVVYTPNPKDELLQADLDRLQKQNIDANRLISELRFALTVKASGKLETRQDTVWKTVLVQDDKDSVFVRVPVLVNNDSSYYFKDSILTADITVGKYIKGIVYSIDTGPVYADIWSEKRGFLGLGNPEYKVKVYSKNNLFKSESVQAITKKPKEVYLTVGPYIGYGVNSKLEPDFSVGLSVMYPLIKFRK